MIRSQKIKNERMRRVLLDPASGVFSNLRIPAFTGMTATVLPVTSQKTIDEENQKGFSLIEVMIAMGLLSIGLLAVLSLQLSSSQFNTGGNLTTIANMITQKRIEEVSIASINDATSILGQETGEESPIIEENVDCDGYESPSGIFRRQTWVTTDPDSSSLKRIKVSVSWTRNGSPKSVTYSVLTRGNIEI